MSYGASGAASRHDPREVGSWKSSRNVGMSRLSCGTFQLYGTNPIRPPSIWFMESLVVVVSTSSADMGSD
jgi:hypothetical protein